MRWDLTSARGSASRSRGRVSPWATPCVCQNSSQSHVAGEDLQRSRTGAARGSPYQTSKGSPGRTDRTRLPARRTVRTRREGLAGRRAGASRVGAAACSGRVTCRAGAVAAPSVPSTGDDVAVSACAVPPVDYSLAPLLRHRRSSALAGTRTEPSSADARPGGSQVGRTSGGPYSARAPVRPHRDGTRAAFFVAYALARSRTVRAKGSESQKCRRNGDGSTANRPLKGLSSW